MTAPWIILAVLFVVPFVDPRRPLRLLHLDLAVLVLFALYSLRWMDRAGGDLQRGLILTNLGLVYLLARMLYDGDELYGADVWQRDIPHGDTYGPVNYLLYVPFAAAFPSSDSSAGHAAAYVWDALMLLALFLLGRRIRPGPDATSFGLALAYAWAAYPYTLFVAVWGYNDALVPLALVCALLVLAHPPLRGVAVALGTAAKLVPAVVAPLFAYPGGRTGVRAAALYAISFAVVSIAVFAPFVPDGGLEELYRRTIGFQRTPGSYASLWQVPALEWLRPVAQAFAIGLAVAVAVVATHKTVFEVAALAAAVIAAFQIAGLHWIPSYVVWFAPLAFVAMFGASELRRDEAACCADAAGPARDAPEETAASAATTDAGP
jgi:hypothetical protein